MPESPCMSRRATSLLPLLIIVSALSFAKKPDLVMMWPPENRTLKLTFGTFHDMGAYAGKMTLVSDVTVQNLTAKVMPRASFNVSLLDRNNVRLGNGLLIIEDLNPGQSAKVQFQCTSVGQPAMLNLAANNSGGVPTSTKAIPVMIVSVPPGATLKVDEFLKGFFKRDAKKAINYFDRFREVGDDFAVEIRDKIVENVS